MLDLGVVADEDKWGMRMMRKGYDMPWDETGMASAIGRTAWHAPVRVAARPQRPRMYPLHHATHQTTGAAREHTSWHPDIILMLAVLAMVLFGVIIVQSASQIADPSFFARHEVVWALIGGVVMLATAQIDYRRWHPAALPG
ncbi:MAG TPA: hypothetical protein VKB76_15845, partial [Ktedonobacterales bacterium]|nr:hypothetical protein [Ktedonobacterales bacterium]